MVDPRSVFHGLVHVGCCWVAYCNDVRLDFLRELVRDYAKLEVGGVQVLLPHLPRTKAEVLKEIEKRPSDQRLLLGWRKVVGYRIPHDLADKIDDYPVCYLNSTPEWSRLKAAILRFTRVLSDKNVFT